MPPQYPSNIDQRFNVGREPAGWPARLFAFSLFILVLLAVSYFGLVYGYKPFLQKDIRNIQSQTEQLDQQVSPADRQAFIAFYSQIENLKSLLSKHVFSSKIFPFIETNTRKDVAYNSMDLDVASRTANLSGTAANYESLASQLDVFQNLSEVKSVAINGATVGQGGVSFQIQIIFNNGFFL
ncbi:MAG: hypothetical protein M1586_02120 [Patescibacteria group bacterium]|nr:hypothetical protein [Patescibacteria group bacterium]MCL5262077.1 hypothetical protein [Patescibacteria group bacterium]